MNIYDLFPAAREWTDEECLAVARTVHQWADREVIAKRQTLREDYEQLLLPALRTLQLELGLLQYPWTEGLERATATLTLTLALEQAGRADVGLSWLMATALAPAAAVALGPDTDRDQRQSVAGLFCGDGERARTCALVLPVLATDGASDALTFEGRRLQARARPEGDGWIIDGERARPLCCGLGADLFGVLCAVEGEEEPSLFLLGGDGEGIVCGGLIQQTGLAASRNATVTFEGVRAPSWSRVLIGSRGYRRLLSWLDLLGAAGCVGALSAGFEILKDWGDNRVIKGKGQLLRDNPLAASVMADLAQRVALCRLLLFDLARMLARPDLYGEEGSDPVHVVGRSLAQHVAASAEAGLNHTMELMGSAGYATEWNLERYWRDVKTMQVHLGSEELCRVEVARHFYGSQCL